MQTFSCEAEIVNPVSLAAALAVPGMSSSASSKLTVSKMGPAIGLGLFVVSNVDTRKLSSWAITSCHAYYI